jgi:hypothetical protein
VEGGLEVLRRSLMMLMDTQERVRADIDRIVVNTELNNEAGVLLGGTKPSATKCSNPPRDHWPQQQEGTSRSTRLE